MCHSFIGFPSPTALLIGPLVNPMWFISKYLSYSTLFTCCIISSLAYATPVVNTSLARCPFQLATHFRQTGATPVTRQSTRPLHFT